ncbi:HAD family hydrolase [Salinivibrio costicola]|uniref:HAD-IIB family hydrolase n=1 Tax=Salinivibrio costicola TaxID=51367 RepID=A0ABX6K3A5_SALCS|nr:HAD-IIB family hydrolase [Salinivibrio costicola]QIR06042.1 HAD-IIB family hydrolase [Salinivibrio costicola]
MTAPLPIAQLSQSAADWRELRWLLTDVDDTLTWRGALPWQTLQALTQLRDAGIRVIPVTGACAGWCDHIANAWPVDAVIGENGAFVMQRQNGTLNTTINHTAQQAQAALLAFVQTLLSQYPARRIASDQAYRVAEVAIDIGQHTPAAPKDEIRALLDALHAYGANATASSIHINAWVGDHSKKVSSFRYLAEQGLSGKQYSEQVAFIGDSLNDSQMFASFPLSVGVANIAHHLPSLPHPPQWITTQPGGFGFAEFAHQLLTLKRH